MIRYHSFYAAHREGQYDHLMTDRDPEMFRWVQAFNRYDAYSKGDGKPDAAKLRPETPVPAFVVAASIWSQSSSPFLPFSCSSFGRRLPHG